MSFGRLGFIFGRLGGGNKAGPTTTPPTGTGAMVFSNPVNSGLFILLEDI